ncbi:hypothetical protein BB559_002024 [Furculomyces boomerangus]|uniref:tRNA-splicing endonuclease subunit Sen54 N-terminal domain-containing protein n=1 Tax=Furculomyces boomerangus TaxID=61424 RepID=A0A2T9YYW4_9FUNG|nr:hypothetical protein BB559_002024 [Furculomyces boomerangus]
MSKPRKTPDNNDNNTENESEEASDGMIKYLENYEKDRFSNLKFNIGKIESPKTPINKDDEKKILDFLLDTYQGLLSNCIKLKKNYNEGGVFVTIQDTYNFSEAESDIGKPKIFVGVNVSKISGNISNKYGNSGKFGGSLVQVSKLPVISFLCTYTRKLMERNNSVLKHDVPPYLAVYNTSFGIINFGGLRFSAEETIFLYERGLLDLKKHIEPIQDNSNNLEVKFEIFDFKKNMSLKDIWAIFLTSKTINSSTYQLYSYLHRLGYITVSLDYYTKQDIITLLEFPTPGNTFSQRKGSVWTSSVFLMFDQLRKISTKIVKVISAISSHVEKYILSNLDSLLIPKKSTNRDPTLIKFESIDKVYSYLRDLGPKNTENNKNIMINENLEKLPLVKYALFKPSTKNFSKKNLLQIIPDWHIIFLNKLRFFCADGSETDAYRSILDITKYLGKSHFDEKFGGDEKSVVIGMAEPGLVSFLNFRIHKTEICVS